MGSHPATPQRKLGLDDAVVAMTQSVSLRTPITEYQSDSPTFKAAGFEWRCLPDYRALVESQQFNWLSLRESPGALRIKRNGHRDVWRIELPGEVVFAKRYRSESVVTRLKAMLRGPMSAMEWEVGHYAASNGIDAVLPVACGWKGPRTWSGPSLLITRGVPGAVPLCDYWLTVRDEPHRANAICRSTARLVARAHQCGFHHLDMHAGNIIVQTQQCGQPRPIFVDLHNVRIGRSVSPRDVVANLAQLNQWFRRHATRPQRLRFLRAYLSARDEFATAGQYARNWTIDPRELLTILATVARRHAEKLWAKRDRRSMRTGRYFARVRPASGWRGHALLISKHPRTGSRASHETFEIKQWRQWLSDPTMWTDPTCTDVLKDSHSAVVCRSRLALPQPLPVICKRPLARSTMKRLLYAIGPSRNMRAWRRANMLLNRDLPAAQPLAVVERRALGLIRTDSVLITELVEGATDLEAFLIREVGPRSTAIQRRAKDGLIAAVATLVRDMSDRGFAHRDFKAANLLVRWDAPFTGRPDLTLIDMDGISHRRGPRFDAGWRALVRLGVSLDACPILTRTDRLRMLHALLLKTGRPLTGWKDIWLALAEQSEHKLRLKTMRREWKLSHYGRE